jgi:hypothetical protein
MSVGESSSKTPLPFGFEEMKKGKRKKKDIFDEDHSKEDFLFSML